jgi:phage gp36-like protein
MKITADDVRDLVVRRGIEDMVTQAVTLDRVDDADLRKLLQAARDAIIAVDSWLRERYGDDYKWE